VFAGVAAFVAVDAAREPGDEPSPTQQPARTAEAVKAKPAPEAAPQPQMFTLPERSGLGAAQSPLFESQSWQPPPPPAAKVKPGPPPAPTAPPLPFTFAGKLIQDGRLSVLLARGDSIVAARQGDTLDDTYRVESITDMEVTLVYLPLGQRQTIPVVSALAAPGTAAPTGATSTPAAGSSGASPPGAQPVPPIPASKVIGQPPG
jgi:hypothetical protein